MSICSPLRAARVLVFLGAAFCLALVTPWTGAQTKPKPSSDDPAALFRDHVRPVLQGKCLTCHAPDRKKGGLDLSRRATALAGGKQGPALVPGKAEASLLYQRLAAGEMPPQNPLAPRQLAAFKKWIDAGAPYSDEPLTAVAQRAGPDWWAFQPVRRPPVPRSRFDHLARTPIDPFLFARLQARGLQPSPQAGRLALLRRVSIDLTGLPPTPAEVDAFLADPAPDAYEKVVDRLLASPHYGERWGRHWLDVVRYGESHGYEQNHLRPYAWPYRDYVIRAFNQDRPYDRFLAEQLAGDVLGKGDPQVEVATGFLVAGVHDTVGNGTVEGTLQDRASDLDDMVGTIGATFLGLTVSCAKCHDHKFDPISQKDYYRLTAVVAGVRHGERALSGPKVTAADELAAEKARNQIYRVWTEIMELAFEGREAVLRAQGIDPVPRPAIHPSLTMDDFAPVQAKFVRLTILATQKGDEPCLDELEVYGADLGENLALASAGGKASASSLLPGYAIHRVHHLNDGRHGNNWSWVGNERGRGWAQIELAKVQPVQRVVWGRDGSLKPLYNDRLASKYRLEVSLDGKEWQTVATSDDRSAANESIPHRQLYDALPRPRQRRWVALVNAYNDLCKEMPPEPEPARALTAYAGQFTVPDTIQVLERGDVTRRGERVTPGPLSQLPGVPAELDIDAKLGEPGRRLALARWLTDPRNPLTARVLVNRVWQYHFGQGLVGTPSDFGFSGQRPTHPELLDWLAADFVEHGWRLKRLHRLMVTSAAYMQTSDSNPQGEAADAGNHLLWRMTLRRLEAEALRDSILAASGGLDRRMGGPGYPLFKYSVVNVAIYEPLNEYGKETWRRGVYQQAARAIRDDLMASFDCPECAQRAPRRDVTTTPLQALSLLNGAFTVAQAELFAERVRKEAGDGRAAQVERAFRLAFGRAPSAAEARAAEALVERNGLAALCRALLNANEFLYY